MELSVESRLKAILDGTGAGTWEWNVDSGEMRINERWAAMLGYSLDELGDITFKTWENLAHPDDRGVALKKVRELLEGVTDQYDCVMRMRRKSGGWRYIHGRGILLVDSAENAQRWLVGTHLDITEQRQAQMQLRQLAESLPGIIYSFEIDTAGAFRFPYVSRKVEDFYGFSADTMVAEPERAFNVVHPDDLPRVRESIARSHETLDQWKCDYRVLVDGRETWVRGISQPQAEPDGVVIWHGMIINIDDQKKLEAELERLSLTDELTGAYNRRYVLRELENLVAEQERYGHTFSLVAIDIDDFKLFNDTHGHLVGDGILREFAHTVQDRIRRTDVFARTGREEFLILMPHTSIKSALQFAEALRESVAEKAFSVCGLDDLKLTISAGVVGCEQVSEGAQELLAVCDRMLYKAKRNGRNRVCCHQ